MTEKETLDYFGTDINIGDTVSFPSIGEMEDGKVIKISNNWVYIINSSGYRKKKLAKNIINKSKIINALKSTFPEEFL